MASANRDEYIMNSVRDLRADGHSRVHVGNHFEVHNYSEPNRNRCLADLRLTDPPTTRRVSPKVLLWTKGDTGKGKTMLTCGIINELSQPRAEIPKASKGGLLGDVTMKISNRFQKELSLSSTHSHPVSFFFCQGTDSRLNSALIFSPRPEERRGLGLDASINTSGMLY